MPSRALSKTTSLTGRVVGDRGDEVAHQHGQAAVTAERHDLTLRSRAAAPRACGIAFAIEPRL